MPLKRSEYNAILSKNKKRQEFKEKLRKYTESYTNPQKITDTNETARIVEQTKPVQTGGSPALTVESNPAYINNMSGASARQTLAENAPYGKVFDKDAFLRQQAISAVTPTTVRPSDNLTANALQRAANSAVNNMAIAYTGDSSKKNTPLASAVDASATFKNVSDEFTKEYNELLDLNLQYKQEKAKISGGRKGTVSKDAEEHAAKASEISSLIDAKRQKVDALSNQLDTMAAMNPAVYSSKRTYPGGRTMYIPSEEKVNSAIFGNVAYLGDRASQGVQSSTDDIRDFVSNMTYGLPQQFTSLVQSKEAIDKAQNAWQEHKDKIAQENVENQEQRAQDTYERYSPTITENGAMKILGDLSENIGYNAPYQLLAMVPGVGTGLSTTARFGGSYIDAYGNARNAGASVNQANLAGTLEGFNQGVGELALGGINGAGTSRILQGLSKAGVSVSNPLIKAGLNAAGAALEEGLEEVEQDIISYFIEKTYNPDAKLSAKDLAYSGLLGALSAAPNAVISIPAHAKAYKSDVNLMNSYINAVSSVSSESEASAIMEAGDNIVKACEEMASAAKEQGGEYGKEAQSRAETIAKTIKNTQETLNKNKDAVIKGNQDRKSALDNVVNNAKGDVVKNLANLVDEVSKGNNSGKNDYKAAVDYILSQCDEAQAKYQQALYTGDEESIKQYATDYAAYAEAARQLRNNQKEVQKARSSAETYGDVTAEETKTAAAEGSTTTETTENAPKTTEKQESSTEKSDSIRETTMKDMGILGVNKDIDTAADELVSKYGSYKNAVDAVIKAQDSVRQDATISDEEKQSRIHRLQDIDRSIRNRNTARMKSYTDALSEKLKQYGVSGVKIMDVENDNVRNSTKVNGYYDPKTKTVYVSPYLDDARIAGAVAVHEFTHYGARADHSLVNDILKAKDTLVKSGTIPEAMFDFAKYESAYTDEVSAYIASEDGRNEISALMQDGMTEEQAKAQASKGYVNEEIAAHFMQEILSKDDALDRLAKENRPLLKRILDAIVDFFSGKDAQNRRLAERAADKIRAVLRETEDVEVDNSRKSGKSTARMQSIADENAKIGNTGDGRRFSLTRPMEEAGNLIAVHNVNKEKALKILDADGMPMPSIAIAKADIGHSDFGNISFVFGAETVDPKANRYNKVYSADVWSPTFPSIEYETNQATESRIVKLYNSIKSKYGSDIAKALYPYYTTLSYELDSKGGAKGIISALSDDTGMMNVFLADTGETPVKNVVKETSTEMSANTREMAQYLIDTRGADFLNDANRRDGETSISARNRFLESHEQELRDTLQKYYERNGIDAETAKIVVESTRKGELMSQLVKPAQSILSGNTTTTSTTVDYEATNEKILDTVDKKKYKEWLNNLFGDAVKNEGIRNGKDPFTPSGNRRSFSATHYPVTLDNIVKAMRGSENVKGATTMTENAKAIRSASAEEYKSIDAIHKNEGRLQKMSESEITAQWDAFDNRLYAIIDSLMDSVPTIDDRLIESRRIGQVIIEASRNPTESNIRSTLEKYSGKGAWYKFTDQTVSDIQSLVNDIRKAPTNIFEAKPERVVSLDEIKYAVVPDDLDKDTVQRIADKGIEVRTYESDNEESRLETLNKLDGVRFSKDVDAEAFSYDALVSKPDMKIVNIESNVDSNATRANIIEMALENAKKHSVGEGSGSSVYVKNNDSNTEILVGKNGLEHGLHRNYSKNADLTAHVGEFLENAILINRHTGRDKNKEGDVYLGLLRDNENLYIGRAITNDSNVLENVETLYALSNKKESVAHYRLDSGDNLRLDTDSYISISDFLDIVKDKYSDVLPKDVLKALNVERKPSSISDSMRYSKDIDTEYMNAVESEDGKKTENIIRYSYGGVNAETANIQTLNDAKILAEQGKTNEEIRRMTGWFKGMDDKWRFEIDDSKMKLRYEATLYDYNTELREKNRAWMKLTERALTDEQRSNLADYMKGAENNDYDDALYSKLSEEFGNDFDKWAETIEFVKEAKKSIPDYTKLGELVDAPDLFEKYPDMADITVEFRNLKRGQNGGYIKRFDNIELSRDLKHKPEELLQSLTHEVQHAIQNREGFTSGANPDYWGSRKSENDFDGRTPTDLYYNTAGEIEARDVSNRRNLTVEQRREKAPDYGSVDMVFADRGNVDVDTDSENIRYSKEVDADGKPYVRVDDSSIDAENPSDIVKVLRDIAESKGFYNMEINGQNIGISNKRGINEWVFSRDATNLLKNDKQTFDDKMQSFQNANELLETAKSFINEEAVHKKKFDNFARGVVRFMVGDNGYTADILVGIRNNQNAELYDIVNIAPTKIAETPNDSVVGETTQISNGISADTSLPQSGESVNRTGESVTEMKQSNGEFRNSKDVFTPEEREKIISKGYTDYLARQFVVKDKSGEYAKAISMTARKKLAQQLAKPLKGVNASDALVAITPVFETIEKADGTPEQRAEKAYKAAEKAANDIISMMKDVNTNTLYDQYAELRNYLRTTKLDTSSVKADIADYNDWRKSHMGSLKLGNDGMQIDTAYQELSGMYPEFFPANIENPADQLIHIGEISDNLKKVMDNPILSKEGSENVVRSFANAILAGYEEYAQETLGSQNSRMRDYVKTAAETVEQKNAQIKDAQEQLADTKADFRRFAETVQTAYETDVKHLNEQIQARDKSIARLEKYVSKTEKGAMEVSRKKAISAFAKLQKTYDKPTTTNGVPENWKGIVSSMLNAFGNEDHAINAQTAIDQLAKMETLVSDSKRYDSKSVRVSPEQMENLSWQISGLRTFFENFSESQKTLGTSESNGIDINTSKNAAYIDSVRNLAETVNHLIRAENELFVGEKKTEASAIAYDFIDEIRERGKKFEKTGSESGPLKQWASSAVLDYTAPDVFLHNLGETGDQFAKAYREAQNKSTLLNQHYGEAMHSLVGDNYSADRTGIKGELMDVSINGENLKVSRQQLMSLYLLWKRPQARQHIEEGGVYFLNANGEQQGKPIVIHESEYRSLIGKLSNEDIRIADGIGKYLSETCAEWGNEASMKLYGYKKFNDPNYFPITVHGVKDQYHDEIYSVTNSLEHKSFTKHVDKNSVKALDIHDIFTVSDNHAKEMAQYSGFAPINSTFTRVYNAPGVQTALLEQYGRRVIGYMNDFLDRANGKPVGKDTKATDVSQKFASMAKKAAVGFNVSTAMKQPISYLRAAPELDMDVFAKAGAKIFSPSQYKALYNEMVTNSGIARIKALGFSDVGIGKEARGNYSDLSFSSAYNKGKFVKSKFEDASMWLAGKADEITWVRIWDACKMQIDKENAKLSAEKRIQLTTEKFNQIVGRTQVVDSVLDSAPASYNSVFKILHPFMNEPMKTVSSLWYAYEEMKKGVPGGKQKFVKQIAATATSNLILEPLIASVIGALRDKEDEDPEKFAEKVLNKMSGISLDSETPTSFRSVATSEIVSGIAFAPMASFFYSIFTDVLNGFEGDSMNSANLYEFMKASVKLTEALMKGEDYSGQKSIYNLASECATSMAQAFGIPANTMRKDLNAVLRTALYYTQDIVPPNNIVRWEMNKLYYNLGNKSARTEKYFYNILVDAYNQEDKTAYNIMREDLDKMGIQSKEIVGIIEKRGGVIKPGSSVWNTEVQARFDLPTKSTGNKVEQMVTRVYTACQKIDTLDENKALPKRPDKYYYTNDDGDKVEMTTQEYDKFVEDVGVLRYKLCAEMAASNGWSKLNAEQQLYALTKAYDFAARYYRQKFNKDYNSGDTWMKELYGTQFRNKEVASTIISKAFKK